jgi:hypothetical protein
LGIVALRAGRVDSFVESLWWQPTRNSLLDLKLRRLAAAHSAENCQRGISPQQTECDIPHPWPDSQGLHFKPYVSRLIRHQ